MWKIFKTAQKNNNKHKKTAILYEIIKFLIVEKSFYLIMDRLFSKIKKIIPFNEYIVMHVK